MDLSTHYASSTSDNKSDPYITIEKITVSYYDNSDGWMPKYDTSLNFGRAYGDPIYYQDGDATEWTEATDKPHTPQRRDSKG